MRKLLNILLTVAVTLGAALPLRAADRAILASSFDLDGEAADDDQVVTAATIADDTSYTVAAQPDVCRLVDVTITDANSSITVGTVTILGTDCWGYALKATFDMSGGSGVRTGTVVAFDSAHSIKTSGAYFASITTVTDATVTGEGGAGDTIKVGYTSNSQTGYPMYGVYTENYNRRGVNLFGSYEVIAKVINGAATTDVVSLDAANTAPFANVSVNDLLMFLMSNGVTETRRVVTRTDADTITINQGLTIPSGGLAFRFKKFYFSTDPIDGWIPVDKYGTVTFEIQVDANADTGGVVTSIECGTRAAENAQSAIDITYPVDTDTAATGGTGSFQTSIDLWLAPNYNVCRAGIKFGTGDDADAAAENIDIVFGAR